MEGTIAMWCPYCGFEGGSGSFCVHCGSKIGAESCEAEDSARQEEINRTVVKQGGASGTDVDKGDAGHLVEMSLPIKKACKRNGSQTITLVLTIVFCGIFVAIAGYSFFDMSNAIYDLNLQLVIYGVPCVAIFLALYISFLAIPASIACRSIVFLVSGENNGLGWLCLSVESGSLVGICLALEFLLDPLLQTVLPTIDAFGEGLLLFIEGIWYEMAPFTVPAACMCFLIVFQTIKTWANGEI